MTPLQRALIEKAGYDHGFERVLPDISAAVHLGSARHPARVTVSLLPQGYAVTLLQGPPTLEPELARSFAHGLQPTTAFLAATELDLAQWLRRAAALAQSLPNQAALDFDTQVQQALAELPPTETLSTEVQRLVRQRVGQECYRQAMLSYWGGACAVTGLTMASVLRASHAKPWAQCSTDAERLDVFNGLLLSANLDALFDKFLISFDTQGAILISAAIPENDQVLMGLSAELSLRWLAPEHQPYLEFHRHQFQNRAVSHPNAPQTEPS